MKHIARLILILVAIDINAAQTIAITAPANGASNVNGVPLSVTGTSSGNNSPVYVTIDSTRVAQVTTNGSGAWSYSYPSLGSGAHTITALLSDSSFSQLATTTNSFSVSNAPTISIVTPSANSTIATILPNTTTGTASLTSASVDLLMDGSLWTTVTTDSNGNWTSTYPDVTNASHTITANLKNGGSTVATSSVTFTASNPMATSAETLAATLISKGVTPSSLGTKLGTQTAHGLLVAQGATSALSSLAVGANGAVLIGSAGADPVFNTITALGPSANSIQFTTGAGTLAMKANPVFGNVIVVDSVNGNDSTGAVNGPPFLTIGAAITAASSGNTIYMMPGTYTASSGITIPAGVTVCGVSANAVTIQATNVTSTTTLVTMGISSWLDNVTLSLTSTQHQTLTGITFPSTTASSAMVSRVSLTVNNSTAGSGGTSNVTGILSSGTGSPTGNNPTMYECCVNVNSAGLGTKRAILLNTSANTFNARSTNFYVSNAGGAGSYIAAEVNIASGVLSLHACLCNGPTADISQTAGSLVLHGTRLVNATANSLSFSTGSLPTVMHFGLSGGVTTGGTFYLPPGISGSSSTEIVQRVSQTMVVKGMHIKAVTAPGGAITDTYTLRRNGANTSVTLPLTGAATTADTGNISQTYAAGDTLSVQLVATALSAQANTIVTLDAY